MQKNNNEDLNKIYNSQKDNKSITEEVIAEPNAECNLSCLSEQIMRLSKVKKVNNMPEAFFQDITDFRYLENFFRLASQNTPANLELFEKLMGYKLPDGSNIRNFMEYFSKFLNANEVLNEYKRIKSTDEINPMLEKSATHSIIAGCTMEKGFNHFINIMSITKNGDGNYEIFCNDPFYGRSKFYHIGKEVKSVNSLLAFL